MAYNNGMITSPVSIYDVQMALGTNECDLGSLCKHANINPMAKFKPIRNSKIGELAPSTQSTPSDRYNARFGFSSSIPSVTFNTSTYDPHGKWVYEKPRGGGSKEPYRLTDFVNEADPTKAGYYSSAVPPFAFAVDNFEITSDTTTEGDGGVGFMLYVNSGVNNFYSKGVWHQETCMTISELLKNDSSFIGFAIQDITNTTGGFVAVVTKYQLRNVGSSVPTVALHSKDFTQGGFLSPAVSLLSDASRAGHTFRIIAFLYSSFPSFTRGSTTYNQNNADYSILSTSRNFSATSLEFIDNIDRCETVSYLVQGSIAGLTGFIQGPGLTLTRVGSGTVTYNGRQYYKFQVGGIVYGSFQTPTGHWNPNGQVRINLTVSGNCITNDVNPQGGNKFSVNVSMPNNNTAYNNITLINFGSISAYVYADPYQAMDEETYIQITCTAAPPYITETVYIQGVIKASSPKITS